MNVNNISGAAKVSEITDSFVSSQTLQKGGGPQAQETRPAAVAENRPGESSGVEETRKIAEALNEMMNDLGTNLGFQIREDLDDQVVVEVKNSRTDELIRQIPSEELLKIMEKMADLSGLIFDSQA